ncbi:sterol desaturase family protein [Novosphingobium sp. ZN18A2]|uniref:sterol desaturase family protein n=1 Tax=Novosphingobium sp. ZN18A2 TaxID=3079861 RepID=UPI0030D2812F
MTADQVIDSMKGSIFAQYPGYVFAPVMLIAASFIVLSLKAIRGEKQDFTIWALFNHTFAVERWRCRSAIVDVFLYLANRLIPAFSTSVIVFFIAGILLWGLSGTGWNADAANPGPGAIVTMAVLLVVLLDFGDYLAHRALHRIPVLWELHKVHHSATFLSPVTSFRVHPLESLVYTVCHSVVLAPAVGVLSFFYRIGPVTLIDLMFTTNIIVIVLTLNHLKHSHFQISLGYLDYVIISPHMHQLHHSVRLEHWDKNLGVIFSLWDWAFGTAVREDTAIPVVYGIGRGPVEDARYLTFYGVFLRPLVNMGLLATGRISAEKKPGAENEPPPAQPAMPLRLRAEDTP